MYGCKSMSYENLEIAFYTLPKPVSSFVYIGKIFGRNKSTEILNTYK